MKKILSIFLLAFSGLVQAACPNFVDGTVLTSAALNSAFAAPCITGGQINGAQIGNVAPASGAFSSIANSGGYNKLELRGSQSIVRCRYSDPAIST